MVTRGGSSFATGVPRSPELARHRMTVQVLESWIVVHSVIIGISLGASESLKTVKPRVVALSFYQLFEGGRDLILGVEGSSQKFEKSR